MWHSKTAGTGSANFAAMQYDGNFAVYTSANRVVFHTNTANRPGVSLNVQDDGNLVIWQKGSAIWQSGTFIASVEPSYWSQSVGVFNGPNPEVTSSSIRGGAEYMVEINLSYTRPGTTGTSSVDIYPTVFRSPSGANSYTQIGACNLTWKNTALSSTYAAFTGTCPFIAYPGYDYQVRFQMIGNNINSGSANLVVRGR